MPPSGARPAVTAGDRFPLVSVLAFRFKGLRKAEGVTEILMPGERGLAQAEANMRNGISIPDQVYEELNALGRPYGLSL